LKPSPVSWRWPEPDVFHRVDAQVGTGIHTDEDELPSVRGEGGGIAGKPALGDVALPGAIRVHGEDSTAGLVARTDKDDPP
jgi:hypothetical protein